jgi:hypothetical protein
VKEHGDGQRANGPGRWARGAFAASCALAFVVIAIVLAARWEGMLGTLLGAPRPASAAPVTFPGATSGEQAVSEARARLQRGDGAGALAALDRVSPHEPEYPLAVQLREQAQAAANGARGRQ